MPAYETQIDLDAPVLGLLPNVWYDAAMVHAMLDAIMEGRSEEELAEIAHQAARESLARASTGLYRFVMRQIVTPRFYARHVQRLWGLIHDTGQREIILLDEDEGVRSRTWDWPGHHPLFCTIAVETMTGIFEITGKRDVTVRARWCISRGDDECRALVHWAPER